MVIFTHSMSKLSIVCLNSYCKPMPTSLTLYSNCDHYCNVHDLVGIQLGILLMCGGVDEYTARTVCITVPQIRKRKVIIIIKNTVFYTHNKFIN